MSIHNKKKKTYVESYTPYSSYWKRYIPNLLFKPLLIHYVDQNVHVLLNLKNSSFLAKRKKERKKEIASKLIRISSEKPGLPNIPVSISQYSDRSPECPCAYR